MLRGRISFILLKFASFTQPHRFTNKVDIVLLRDSTKDNLLCRGPINEVHTKMEEYVCPVKV